MLPEREYPLPAGRGRRLPLRLRRLQRRASVLVALVGKPHPIVPYSLRLRRQVRPRRVCHRQRLVRLHAGRLRLLHEEGTRQPRMMSIGARARVACHRREGARRQPPSPARASRSSWRRSSTRCSEPGHRHQQSADADLYGSASDDLSSSHSVPLTAMRTTNVPRAPMTHIGQCHGRWRRRSRDRLARRRHMRHGDRAHRHCPALEGRLFFAGEACSLHAYGTVHGAAATGIAAAEQVAKQRGRRPAPGGTREHGA